MNGSADPRDQASPYRRSVDEVVAALATDAARGLSREEARRARRHGETSWPRRSRFLLGEGSSRSSRTSSMARQPGACLVTAMVYGGTRQGRHAHARDAAGMSSHCASGAKPTTIRGTTGIRSE